MLNKIKVGVIITDNKESILLIKEKTEAEARPLWNIIKGTYGDVKNESILEAAIREGFEEAGVKIELTGLAGCYVSLSRNEAWTQFTFLAKIKKGKPHLAAQKEQRSRNEFICELRWFTKTELMKMKKNEFISNRIYQIVKNWLNQKTYPIESIKQIKK